MPFADLHLHTTFSDGTFSPEELVAEAQRQGLGVLALTDHDTLEGCPRMAAACQQAGIEFIAATELTSETQEKEIHILAYFVDPENSILRTELNRFQEVRQNRIREMTARLNEAGVPLQAETVFALANCRSPGRPHVARALVREGYCGNLDQAFERFLKKGQPAWVPKFKMSTSDAINLVHQAGGVAIMAHPGLTRADELIPELVAAGLDGVECFHTKHSVTAENHYLSVARERALLVTGGSDCHGLNKGRPLVGTVKLPYQYVEQLRARALQRAANVGLHLTSATKAS